MRATAGSPWAHSARTLAALALAVLVTSGHAQNAAPGEAAGLKLSVAVGPANAAFAGGTLDAQDGLPATFAGARLYAIGLRRVMLWNAMDAAGPVRHAGGDG